MLREKWTKNINPKVLVCELGGEEALRWLFGGVSASQERFDFVSTLLQRDLATGGTRDPGVVELRDELCPSVLQPASALTLWQCLVTPKGGPNPDGPSSLPDCHHAHGCPCSAALWASGLTLGTWYLSLPTSCWRSIVFLHWLLWRDFWNGKLTQIITVGMWTEHVLPRMGRSVLFTFPKAKFLSLPFFRSKLENTSGHFTLGRSTPGSSVTDLNAFWGENVLNLKANWDWGLTCTGL